MTGNARALGVRGELPVWGGILVLAVLAVAGGPPMAASMLGVAPPGPSMADLWDPRVLAHSLAALAVTAAILGFLLAPGLGLALLYGRPQSRTEWLTDGFCLTPLVLIAATMFSHVVAPPPVPRGVTIGIWCAITAYVWGSLYVRQQEGAAPALPPGAGTDRRRLMIAGALAGLLVVALGPKLFWENFNLDGIEAFEFGRSLTQYALPTWELEPGVYGRYPNFFLFAYVNHWFMALLGPVESSVRLPFVLYVAMVFLLLLQLIERGASRGMSRTEEMVLVLALIGFVMVQAFSTNYEPFFSDLGEAAATDTLAMAMFLASLNALWSGHHRRFVVFALLTYGSFPGGLLLLGLLALVMFIQVGKVPPAWAIITAATAALALTIGLVHDLSHGGLMNNSNQFTLWRLRSRLFGFTLAEFARLPLLFVPSGFLPALSLLFIRQRHGVRFSVAMVTLGYFGVIYIQSWTSVHQFTPVMILPLIILWRTVLTLGRPRPVVVAAALGALASIYLSRPQHWEINTAARELGAATRIEIGDYEDDYRTMVAAGAAAYALVPEDYRLEYPNQPWGLDAHQWIYYSTRPKAPGQFVNYIVQGPGAEVPPHEALLTTPPATVAVRDTTLWRAHREPAVPRVVASRVYEPVLRRTFKFFEAVRTRAQQESPSGGSTR